jgi:hypothetical protein
VKERVALFNMPAAGKCRKGVLEMKKFLLVMLVPVLVLGIMGCGKVYDGSQVPSIMQGAWISEQPYEGKEVTLVFSGNQMSLSRYIGVDDTATLQFRIGYGGGKNEDGTIDPGDPFDVQIHDYEATKDTKVGTLSIIWGAGDIDNPTFTLAEFLPQGNRKYYSEFLTTIFKDILGPELNLAKEFTRLTTP